MTDAPIETQEAAAPSVRLLPAVRIGQGILLAVLFALLFLATLTAPLYFSEAGGFLGARGVWLNSLLIVLVGIQCILVVSWRWLATQLGGRTDEVRPVRGEAVKFVLLCMFLVTLNVFVLSMQGQYHWGVVSNHDQPQYYVYLHSWVFDQDVNFENEYRAMPGIWEFMTTSHPDRPEYNVAPIGSAILWMPFYLSAHAALLLLGRVLPGVPTDGIAAPYAMACAFGSIALAWVGLILTYRVVARRASNRAALLTVLILWMASPLLWYLTEQPWMSHAPSFFIAAFVVWFWDRTRESRGWKGWAVFGVLIGLAVLVRPTHAALLVLPVSDVVAACVSRNRWQRALAGLGLCVGVTILLFVPQLLTFHARYGGFSAPGSPMRWGTPAVLEVLFSAHRGLFAWHPALLAGLLGLPLLWRRSRHMTLALAVALVVYVYLNASILAWWGGGAFGMRRFVGVLPLLAPGIAAFGSWVVNVCRKRPAIPAAVAVTCFGVYNALLMVQFRDGWSDFLKPVSFQNVWASNTTIFHSIFGNPATYPASVPFAMRHGVTPGQYDIMSGVPPTPEFEATRADLAPHLGKGWNRSINIARVLRGAFIAEEGDCTLLVHLRQGRGYLIEVVLEPPEGMDDGQLVTYGLDGRIIGSGTIPVGKRSTVNIRVPAEDAWEGVNEVNLQFGSAIRRAARDVTSNRPGRGLPIATRDRLSVAAKLWKLTVRYEE
ncbi:MAG: glycosyltransferase family 39 protein [bacterium]|nr:glycosyltransferase family 39 protein [bacterium]